MRILIRFSVCSLNLPLLYYKFGNQSGGYGSAGMGIAGALYKGWMANKQLALAEDALSFQKDAFNKNYTRQNELIERNWNDKMQARANSR